MQDQVTLEQKRGATEAQTARGGVLLYHRVASPATDPLLLCVSPKNFEAQLRVLTEHTSPIALSSLVAGKGADAQGKMGVALTFDDGYADNLHDAAPTLAARNIPATIFVCSGPIDRGELFWWDALERALLHPGELPQRLTVRTGRLDLAFDLGLVANYTTIDFQRHRDWNVTMDETPTARHAAYRTLFDELRELPPARRRDAIEQIGEQLSRSHCPKNEHAVLSADELSALANAPGIEIGAHTVDHPILARLSAEDQTRQIEDSRDWLANAIGHEINTFSYPFGTRHDYNPASVAAARAADFTVACANRDGLVTNETNALELPRLLVRNWDGETFLAKLREWRLVR